MKVLLVLASFGVLASAQYGVPAPLSSNYGPPQQNYGPPSTGPAYGPPSSLSSSYGVPQSGYGSPVSNYAAPSGGYGGAPSGGYSGGSSAAPVVHKHVYVHVPPPEPHYPKAKKVYTPPPPPQKHYKIIFIKAPTPPPPEIPDIPQLPPAPETKTLVYVLVKKPEPAPQVTIPLPTPTKPSKPEVYFIRYKTPLKDGGASGGYASGPSSSSLGLDSGYGAPGASGLDLGPPVGSEYGVPQY